MKDLLPVLNNIMSNWVTDTEVVEVRTPVITLSGCFLFLIIDITVILDDLINTINVMNSYVVFIYSVLWSY